MQPSASVAVGIHLNAINIQTLPSREKVITTRAKINFSEIFFLPGCRCEKINNSFISDHSLKKFELFFTISLLTVASTLNDDNHSEESTYQSSLFSPLTHLTPWLSRLT